MKNYLTKKKYNLENNEYLPVDKWYGIIVGIMHINPSEFWNMSLTEVCMAINGFREYNGVKDEPMTRDELDNLKQMYPDY